MDERVITVEIPQEFDAKTSICIYIILDFKNPSEAIESFQTLRFYGNYQETEK